MKRILCIVVTYNRLELLKRSIDSLKAQTYIDFDTIVIDNGSTDGTKEWLDSQDKDILVIHQDNVGGAGGFFSGMKYALNHGYEWLWMMDDDGVADKNQLKNLVETCELERLDFANALVCNIDTPNRLSFGLSINGAVEMNSEAFFDKKTVCGINPFNGTFINRKVLENIGLIKKEMFIWGDETEYILRAQSAGYEPRTITSAIHYHPAIKGNLENPLPFLKKYAISVKPANLSHIYYRNLGYIYKTYFPDKILRPIVLYTLLFVRTFRFSELKKFYKYYKMGLNEIFS